MDATGEIKLPLGEITSVSTPGRMRIYRSQALREDAGALVFDVRRLVKNGNLVQLVFRLNRRRRRNGEETIVLPDSMWVRMVNDRPAIANLPYVDSLGSNSRDGVMVDDGSVPSPLAGERRIVASREGIPPVLPYPHARWPKWAKRIARWAAAPDKGVGDTAARLIDASVGDARAKAILTALKLGWPCDCERRHRRWDARYPYDGQEGRPQP